MLKCTINGVELEVEEGTTVIEAMTRNEQRIAHYCWHPGLSVAGVCRLCMVEIEGNPRLQIACNTKVSDGMVVTNKSEKVKEAAKWGLDFHLINHPLDCPICDQAGECGLQDQYMEFGQYDPEMAERKVKKRKVVDLGDRVVLDSERCILCTRCVRFTDEVSKTHELGIFNRGDRSEIGTFEDRPMNNNYSLNTVDICPVGALTSKDFRFRQRVWYLKDGPTVCNGCSTGCNTRVFFNKEGLFRVRPNFNKEVNGHWMCDEGRNTYKFVNREVRLLKAKKRVDGEWVEIAPGAAAKECHGDLKAKASATALVLTGQHSVEEYKDLLAASEKLGIKKVFHWINNPDSLDEFDGLLLRGDKNPNTRGLLQSLEEKGITAQTMAELDSEIGSGAIKQVVVFGPENQAVYPDFADTAKRVAKAGQVIWLGTCKSEVLDEAIQSGYQIPLKSYIEKEGTFVNHAGLAQSFARVTTVVSEALTGSEAAALMAGEPLHLAPAGFLFTDAHRRADQVAKERMKKNEFYYRRGPV